jgi:SpoIIAA-like
MLEILKGYPDDVLAITAKGRVTAEDYRKVLIPEADARIARHEALRVLLNFGPDFDGLTAGAAWSDLKFGLSHLSNFGRVALVSDVTWIRDAARLFAPLFRLPFRTFSNAERGAAEAWIVEKDGTI